MQVSSALQREAAALAARPVKVPIDELLTPSFMAACSRFGDATALLEASGYEICSEADLASIPRVTWDAFIRSVSRFANWDAMLREAAAQWALRRLGIHVDP